MEIPEEWSRDILGNLFEFKNGANTEAKNYGSGLKFVNVMDVFGNQSLTCEKIRGSVNLPDNVNKIYMLKIGDVLFNRTSETFDEIALTTVYMDTKPAIFGGFVIRGRPITNRLDPNYCIYCFSSELVRKETIRRGQGVIRSNIGQVDLRRVPLLIPPLAEQKCIAEILSTWDQAIEVVARLIENSQAQKKSLMQQLLTGKKRLLGFANNQYQKTKYGLIPDDWGFPVIGDVTMQITARNIDGVDITVLSCSKYEGFVNSLEYFKKKIYSDDTTNYKVVRRGMFGFPSNHIEEGSIGYQDITDIGIVSPIYTVFETNRAIDDGYLYKLLKTEHYRQIFAANTNASVDRRGSLRWKEFSKIRVTLPSLVEQIKISAAIDAAQAELSNFKGQLNSLQEQKKALMQQFLTGKRRVKIDKEAAA